MVNASIDALTIDRLMHPSRITLFREIFESIISQQTLVETAIERLPDYSWSLFVYAV